MKKFLVLLLCLLCSLSLFGAQADIVLPASLTVIGEEAFAGDSSVTGLVKVPGNVRRIQAGAFSDTNLNALELPGSVAYIEDNIVSGSPVTYVIVRNSDAELSANALSGAWVILSWAGDAASQWAETNGVEWHNLDNVVSYGGFYYYLNYEASTAKLLFAIDPESVGGSLKLPTKLSGCTLTEITEHAFAYCSGVSAVAMPDTVTEIRQDDTWPEIAFSTYATTAAPVLPSDTEYTELEVSDSSLSLAVGTTTWLQTPNDAPEGSWLWYTSNDSIVSVGADGQVSCNSVGTAAVTLMIRAEDGVYVCVYNITVVEPELVVHASQGDYSMVCGQSEYVRYSISANVDQFDCTVALSSSDTGVFTCNGSHITGVSAGEATLIITVTYCGDYTAAAEVPVRVTDAEVGMNSELFTYVGMQEQLVLMGSTSNVAEVEWVSDNEEIATVTDEGLVTIHSVGEESNSAAHITCTVTLDDGSEIVLVCALNILDRNPSIYIEADPVELIVGMTESTDCLPLYADHMWWDIDSDTAADLFELSFESSDESVISFADGNYSVNGEGSATVTVTYTSTSNAIADSATAEFTVETHDPHIEAHVDPDYEEVNLRYGSTYCPAYWYDSEVRIIGITYSSSNEAVASIDATGAVTLLAAGETEISITVHTELGSHTDSMTLVVFDDTFDSDVDEITLSVGETYAFTCVPELEEGVYVRDIGSWSDDGSIASVEDSLIVGVGSGTTYVHNEFHLSNDTTIETRVLVTVVDPGAPVTLNANRLTLNYLESYPLEATFSKEPESFVWYSDDPYYADVDDNGVVTVRSIRDEGDFVNVYCTAAIDGVEYTAVCAVSNTRPTFSFYSFPEQIELSSGQTCEIEVWGADQIAGRTVSYVWSTEDQAVATVDQDGVLTALSTGVTTFTCKACDENGALLDEVSGVVYVNTAPSDPEAIVLEQDVYLMTMPGGRYEHCGFNAEIVSDYNWDHGLLRYSSSNEEVATIDNNGNLTAVAPGKTEITVTMAGYPALSDTATLYVVEDVTVGIDSESVQVGETVSITIKGLPDDLLGDVQYNWNYDSNALMIVEDGDTMRILRVLRPEELVISLELFIGDECYGGFDFTVVGTRPETHLNESAVRLFTGDAFELWPEFDQNGETQVWTSSNEAVAIVEEDPNSDAAIVTALKQGHATITLTSLWEGSEITAVCEVYVRDEAWTLHEITLPGTLILGHTYSMDDAYIECASWVYPDLDWSSGNPDVVSINSDSREIIPMAVGEATLTLTASKNGENQTLTKTVRVVEAPARVEYMELRPGASKPLTVVPASGKEIASIEWVSSCESNVTVDENGIATAVGSEGHAYVYAKVAFTDGTSATAVGRVYIIRNEEVWLDFWSLEEYLELNLNEAYNPSSAAVSAWFSTNAMSDEISVSWNVGSEEIVKVTDLGVYPNDSEDDVNDDQYCAQAKIEAVGEGSTWVECTLFNGELNISQSRGFEVRVLNPYYDIVTEESEYTLLVGQSRGLNYQINESEGFGMIASYVYESDDESIVTVDPDNTICAIAPGSATVTISAYSLDGLLDSQEFTVNVVGASLDQTSLVLNKGESAQLTPSAYLPGSYHGCSWSSSNPEAAVVSENGQVLAVGGGTAVITHTINTSEGDTSVSCRVTVPMTDETFYMKESSVSVIGGSSVQLEYVSTDGTPDSVKWSLSDSGWGEIDDNGLLQTYGYGGESARHLTVTCTAAFGEETRTATCAVTITVPAVRIHDFGGVTSMTAGHQEGISVHYTNATSEDVSVELTSDDPEVAVMGAWENGQVYIEAVGSGVTNVHFVVTTADGEVYQESMTVYVDTPFPELTAFSADVDTLLLFAPGCGPFSGRHIPCTSLPEQIPYDAKYSSDNTEIAIVHENGWVEAVAPGTANITIALPDYPDFSTTLPVYVADSSEVVLTGLEEGISVGGEAQISFDCEWPEDAYTVTYDYREGGYDQFILSESGEIFAREPGDYCVIATIDFFGEFIESEAWFTITREEEYIYPYHPDSEFIVHPNQEFWPDVRSSFEIHGWAVTSEDESIVKVIDDHWMGVQPGVAMVTYQAVLEDGSLYPTVLTQQVTVKEAEAPIFDIEVSRIIHVGETVTFGCNIENHYYNGSSFTFEISDSGILAYSGVSDWGYDAVTGVAPGVAYLTVHASYGDMTSTKTAAIHVVEGGYAAVSTGEFEIRPNDVKQLYILPAEGCTVQSVKWVSSNENIATVDQDGNVTGVASEGSAQIMACVTFDDGSVIIAASKVNIATDDSLWLDLHGRQDKMELGLNENYGSDSSQWAYAYFNSNLAIGELTVEWSVEDESVARIEDGSSDFFFRSDDYSYTAFEALANIVAVGEGSTNVTVAISSECGIGGAHTFEVVVTNPSVTIET